MAAKYYLTLTDYGSTQIAQAHDQSPIQLQNLVIGDANNVPYDPIMGIDRTTLVNQKASVPIQDIQIIDDFIRVTATLGTSVGGFNIHEIGLTDETGQLVYIGNYHGGYKPVLEDGAGGQLTLIIDIKGTPANNINLTVDENINTATQAWVNQQLEKKLNKQGGEISENLSINGYLELKKSKLETMTGVDYTITYNHSTRIAIIDITLFKNKPVVQGFNLSEHADVQFFHLLKNLPINLVKRISAEAYLIPVIATVPWGDEASEWYLQCMPVGYDGTTESQVQILTRRWSGGVEEPVDAYLRVIGFF
ncbi:phage tail protein [Acinetobacter tianfuensis]|uniref:Phage tail fibre protein N-terminal domain-containing protein n=1 Tax=Acinetobacter tianfuensis TaxID=2419603 RepID=A0A3A8ECP1_9GAMM|nr:phage tail protein [Acinetobacter tianfuensis]RKG32405.1 hypothetical protein D7V32_05550 [Acinetobacter tianfuensis]